MKLTKEELSLFGIIYLHNKENYTLEKISGKIGVAVCTVSRWLKRQKISAKYFDEIISIFDFMDNNLNKKKQFLDELFNTLGIEYEIDKCRDIVENNQPITKILYELLEINKYNRKEVVFTTDIKEICSEFKSLLYEFNAYITVSDQILDFSLLTDTPSLFTDNYIILNFGSNYKVAIIFLKEKLENIIFPNFDNWTIMKGRHNIDLIILFSAYATDYNIRGMCLKSANMFVEHLNKSNLHDLMFRDLSYNDITEIAGGNIAKLYARLAFEKFTGYFVIIKNDIIFKRYINDRGSENGRFEDFREFIDRCFIKEIMDYSYLSRHALYFERDTLKEFVEQKTSGKKLGTVIELFFSNSFLTSAICDKCDRLLLFSSSDRAVNYMQDKVQQGIIPNNVEVIKTHIDPEYITSVLNGLKVVKVDLVVMGMGMGSCVQNLTDYLRTISNWLSPRGMISISFTNSESILLKRQLPRAGRFEFAPAFFSDYWQYTDEDRIKCLTHIHQYRLEEIKAMVSTYINVRQSYTYPFISSLVDYDVKERELLDELRIIDKINSKNEITARGHFICITGIKKQHAQKGTEIYNGIQQELRTLNIEYIQADSASIVASNQYSNFASNILKMDAVAIKLLALQNKKGKIELLILPAEKKFSKKKHGGNLIAEKRKDDLFGVGPISPLVVLPSILKKLGVKAHCYITGIESLRSPSVIFCAGDNMHALVMRKADFVELMNKIGIKKRINVLEDEL